MGKFFELSHSHLFFVILSMGTDRIEFREKQDFEPAHYSLDLVSFSKQFQNTACENLRKSLNFQIADHFKNSLKTIFLK